ncbi:adenylate/guanylate cyclase domain-containing protein [Sphaerospermopsis aphanizomenoides BCCUSP55]|uniref:adenylate/guanylate cyclase domain-containing protein n=1 Tax=Sphaerospermopsis aphanizomenoides TaxID=459663 RepID=UPI001903E9E2|nr:adenylate/guanylate cyclase domain-containing protein [Sphaerospermopsis aphanizomenoides]MBK1990662.1 adenylate/guanylate cyclase domain-containing protein [Sphaerospermopsis aphanizomenoides BCCUSP55]
MIPKRDFGITQLEDLFTPEISDWQIDASFVESYREQRRQFLIKRLKLQTQIMLLVGLTLTVFFMWVNQQPNEKIYAFKIGLILESFILICWFLCKTPLGRRYPHMIFLALSWCGTCVTQIDTAILFNYVEPFTNIWNLMFITQATIVPVLWRLHLISQIGTLICYAILYLLYRPQFSQPLYFYVEHGIYLFWTSIICVFSVYLYEKLRKNEFRARQEIEIAKQQSEKLLLNILPEVIAEQLKLQPTTIADSFLEVTVLFADIVGFTELSSCTSPPQLVELLNEIFCLFDQLAERHGVEKIKTIGDAYMAVAGLPNHRSDHAIAIANMALDMQQAVNQFNQQQNQSFRIRIGISTGPVVAGVIGLKKFAYDLWGDTVNTASRMESHGIAGCIQVCEASYHLLQEKYFLKKRGLIKVKGKGEMLTYLLLGAKFNHQ